MFIDCARAIIPTFVLDRFAADVTLSDQTRSALLSASQHASGWRGYRVSLSPSARHAKLRPTTSVRPLQPSILLFDCRGSTSQPGDLIEAPETSTIEAARHIHRKMTELTNFYKRIFNRNSIDNHGMGLLSSIHFGENYPNAYWNGAQMIFGDGDGEIFCNFAQADDVLAHEFAHGVTQFLLGLGFWDQAGALNESISDVFASVFRQWRMRQPSDRADWKIGSTILGPKAIERGYTCLRSLSTPDAVECIAPQPKHMRNYDADGDPHINSGIPNHAFYLASMATGGNTWDRLALVWYSALASGRRQPNMSFEEFAKLTIARATALFRNTTDVPRAVEQAWRDVGVI